MSWGRVIQDGGVEPIKKPEPVDPAIYEDDTKEVPKELSELNAAIEAARAFELPGAPETMIPSISLCNYEPPPGALNSALGLHGH